MRQLVFCVITLAVFQRAHSGNVAPKLCTKRNEIYSKCGSACPLTCENYNKQLMCTLQCVEGCFCEKGHVRDGAGNCVLPADCPKGRCIQKNEIYTTCGTACPPTCGNYKNPPKACTKQCVIGCQCQDGYVRNEADGSCVLPSKCPATQVCPLNEVFTTCGTACPLTCDNYKNPPQACTLQCVIGCQCQKGYVKDSDGKCILPSDCKPKVTEPQEPCCKGPNEVFKSCGTHCPKTCATKNVMFKCKEGCQPGCYCADGYLRNTYAGTTVCPLNEEYTTCGTACPLTCDNYKNPPVVCTLQCVIGSTALLRVAPRCAGKYEEYKSCGSACPPTCNEKEPRFCTANCVPGCYCQKGYVRNTDDNSCCLPSDCPVTQVCPLNEKYTQCGTACPLTCDNYNDPPQFCTMQCFVGCECEEGYVRNSADGSCCTREECPVTQQCPLNEKYNACGTACPLTCNNYKNPPEFCTTQCVDGCECIDKYVRNEANGTCCLPEECPAPFACPLNEQYYDCGTACPLTCDNYKNPPQICTMQCVIGCQCKPGYVRNKDTGSCCLPKECPATKACPLNEEYTTCGTACPATCANYDKPIACTRQCVADLALTHFSHLAIQATKFCPLNEKYNECGTACPPTCENYKNPPEFCTDQCVDGCECIDGYVRNEANGTCCLPRDCPAPKVCPLNEQYYECGTACPLTCDNYKNPPKICTLQCVIGCQCKPGYVRNKANGSCCLPAQCPATQKCPLNEKYNECGTACPATCENYQNPPQFCTRQCVDGCECIDGYVRNEANGTCCLPRDCPAPKVCPLNEQYYECGTACPLTCDNYKNPPKICTLQCVIGCQCKPGYVRNKANGSCCLPAQCPATQKCPLNEKYNECGTACPATCGNYKNPPQLCTKQCVVGCECIDGYVRNEENGTCCLPRDCPAPKVCPLNEQYYECGTACPLTCDNYKNPPKICTLQCVIGCQCKPGYVRNKANGSCCLPVQCPATQKCPLNEKYNECGTACPATCENYQNPPQFCTRQCVDGCECIDGYVRNEANGTCCLPRDCPAPKVCPLNEQYYECGTACPLTCDNYKNPPKICTLQCVIGCQCKPGYVRNKANGSCCLPAQCPATQNCPLNEKYNECGTACPATCENYQNPPQSCTRQCVDGCECIDGYVRNEANGTCCLPRDCPAPKVCPLNEQYYECGTACPLTCDNYKNPPKICTLQCVIGCQCKPGYVRNKANGSCCLPAQCPATQNCPLNEKYNECGTACPATCENYQNPPQSCTRQCVDGCECIDGYVRNEENGTCCLPRDCPVLQPICPSNEVFQICGSACPLNCGNYKNPPQFCTKQCVQGCFCKGPYVRDIDGTCVHPLLCKPKVIEPQQPYCKGHNEVYKSCGTLCPKTCASKDIMFNLNNSALFQNTWEYWVGLKSEASSSNLAVGTEVLVENSFYLKF
ncbi:Zonadhesin [Pseudolycoriella hygida]|uniref:Zonadhesin n=1 Tax=Pseudolycoriella hygida TaxID=35572 RepID=A0A9Q0MPX6_9DIPT|nr:Zonadhesin [Pseudolycoriella hygida]